MRSICSQETPSTAEPRNVADVTEPRKAQRLGLTEGQRHQRAADGLGWPGLDGRHLGLIELDQSWLEIAASPEILDAVGQLLAAGINVLLGQDDISDAYYAFGRNHMLEVAFLGAHLLWMMTGAGREAVYDMVTNRAARSSPGLRTGWI